MQPYHKGNALQRATRKDHTMATTFAELCPHTHAFRKAFMAALELETRNPTVRRFFRRSMDAQRADHGCLAITSTPFTLVIICGDRVAAALYHCQGGVRMEPFSAKRGHTEVGPKDAVAMLRIAENVAQSMRGKDECFGWAGARAEVWSGDALAAYAKGLLEAGAKDGL